MAKLTKVDKLLLQTRNNFSAFGLDPNLTETQKDTRFEYAYKGKLFAVIEVQGDAFYVEVLATKERLPEIQGFKSSRMAYAAIPKRKNWFCITLKADQRDLLESQIDANVGAIRNQLKAG